MENKNNSQIKERTRADTLLNLAAHVPLFMTLPILHLMAGKYEILKSAIDMEALKSGSSMPLTENALIGGAILATCKILKDRNDDQQLSKIVKNMSNPPMLTEGLHAYVRHPTYLLQRAMAIGWTTCFPTTEAFIGLAGYFALSEILARREEKTVEMRYGDDYREYKSKTPRWLPDSVSVWGAGKKCLDSILS